MGFLTVDSCAAPGIIWNNTPTASSLNPKSCSSHACPCAHTGAHVNTHIHRLKLVSENTRISCYFGCEQQQDVVQSGAVRVNTNSPQRSVVRALPATEITAVLTVTWESWQESLESAQHHRTIQAPGFSLPVAECLSFSSSPASIGQSVIPFLPLSFGGSNPLLMNLDHLLVWQWSIAAGDAAGTPVSWGHSGVLATHGFSAPLSVTSDSEFVCETSCTVEKRNHRHWSQVNNS